MRLGRLYLLLLALSPATACAADPSALWKIVDGACVPHQQATNDPSPCAEVHLGNGAGKGFAVLKDIRGATQYLLIPTARIGGIEDPAILAPNAENYWADAWDARSFVEDRLHRTLPRSAVSLAINSVYGRTQDQLHIHIDCVRPDVRDSIAANLDRIERAWAPYPVPLSGHMYRAIRIERVNLGPVDPFRLLADADPTARDDMGRHTLVLVGATFPADGQDGFVLLDDRADLMTADRASGEELQDHDCALVRTLK
jgi:CDP-diacylglycerol pyrophosphatase